MALRKFVDLIFRARGLREMSQEADEAAQQSSKLNEEAKKARTLADEAGAAYARMVASIASISTVLTIITQFRQEMEEIDRATKSVAGSFVDLAALDPQRAARNTQLAQQFARQAARPDQEVAPAFFEFLSSTGDLTSAQQVSLFQEVIEAAKVSGPDTPLRDVASLFGTAQTISGEQDFQRLGNILRASAVEGKLDTGRLARFFPRLIGPLQEQGLGFEESAGLFAAASRLAGTTEEATTGLRAFIGQGLLDPEKRKAYGISGNPLQAIEQLQRRGLSTEEAKDLAGTEGFAVLLGLVNRPDVLTTALGGVRESALSGSDRDVQEFRYLMENDALFRAGFEARRADVFQTQARTQPTELDKGTVIQQLDALAQQRGVNPFSRYVGRAAGNIARGVGAEGETISDVTSYFQEFGSIRGGELNRSAPIGRGETVVIQGDYIAPGGQKINERVSERESLGGPTADRGGAR